MFINIHSAWWRIVSVPEKTPSSPVDWLRTRMQSATEFLAARQNYGNNLFKGAPCALDNATACLPKQNP